MNKIRTGQIVDAAFTDFEGHHIGGQDAINSWLRTKVEDLSDNIVRFVVVDELPTEDIDTHAIYLLAVEERPNWVMRNLVLPARALFSVRQTAATPAAKSGTDTTTAAISTRYDEYIYINGEWEKVGEDRLDLSGYATTGQIEQLWDAVLPPQRIENGGVDVTDWDLTVVYRADLMTEGHDYDIPAATLGLADYLIDGEELDGTGFTSEGLDVVLSVNFQGHEIEPNFMANVAEVGAVYIGRQCAAIGGQAFAGCANLTVANFDCAASLAELGNEAFAASGLQRVTLPPTVATIGEAAFAQCARLAAVDMNDCAANVSKRMLYNCPALRTLTIGRGAKIMAEALAYSGLERLTVPSSCTDIGERAAFRSHVRHVVFGEGLRIVSNNAFDGQPLRAVLPNSLQVVGDRAFAGAERIDFRAWLEPNADGSPADGTAAQLYKIGTGAFAEGLFAEFNLPASPFTLNSTFKDCKNLRQVVMTVADTYAAANNTHSLSGTFEGCERLSELAIPTNCVFGPNTFKGCRSLTTAPNLHAGGCNAVPSGCFEGCVSLSSVNLGGNGGSIARIGERAFYGCTALAAVEAADRVQRVDPYAFYGCTHLHSVGNLPSNATVRDYAFAFCSELDSGSFPWLFYIGAGAFYCSAFRDRVDVAAAGLWSQSTTIGADAFRNCRNLFGDLSQAVTPASVGAGAFDGTEVYKSAPHTRVETVSLNVLKDTIGSVKLCDMPGVYQTFDARLKFSLAGRVRVRCNFFLAGGYMSVAHSGNGTVADNEIAYEPGVVYILTIHSGNDGVWATATAEGDSSEPAQHTLLRWQPTDRLALYPLRGTLGDTDANDEFIYGATLIVDGVLAHDYTPYIGDDGAQYLRDSVSGEYVLVRKAE